MISRSQCQTLLWTAALIVISTICFALMLQVKSVNSRIVTTERAILATKQSMLVLETEFQTRARQQQLVRWNEVEFGYVAPNAGQFFETRQELASLGVVTPTQSPDNVMMADAGGSVEQIGPSPIRAAALSATPTATPGATLAANSARATLLSPSQATQRSSAPAPARLAVAQMASRVPAKQLAARDDRPVRAAPVPRREPVLLDPVKLAPLPASQRPGQSPRAFAERFDLEGVLAGAEGVN
ncbi:hypothetical protein RM533_05630 [Croceicoccus sp. F390]|uniref:Cell division protein FtsL n=1 Tax=Croceicoccus esteveae TaxID=3075597 RepID=A0ABU2ZH89_9SPHN|nr:hypothetical protein [Croceicoccus sp. F390]MDT0575659.1 hypothetical protein [Croceicoccus sp. F390]